MGKTRDTGGDDGGGDGSVIILLLFITKYYNSYRYTMIIMLDNFYPMLYYRLLPGTGMMMSTWRYTSTDSIDEGGLQNTVTAF